MPPICVGQGPGVNQLIIICPMGPILHSFMSANDCDNWCLHFKECCLFLRLEIGLCCTSCVKTATHTSSGSSQYSVLNMKLIRTITLHTVVQNEVQVKKNISLAVHTSFESSVRYDSETVDEKIWHWDLLASWKNMAFLEFFGLFGCFWVPFSLSRAVSACFWHCI